MKKIIKGIDIIGIIFYILLIIAFINITIMVYFTCRDSEEQECVKFYKEHNYITNVCMPYKDKLLEVK